ncbi:HAD-superfamily hydrolase, subfamily IA, variant 3 (fragment) [uncultured Desulfatiglans sp.]|uniref:HAD-superfamily hydrolase, subfamily IA, variant 3 n=1 Tax=Uncultured Desulfatiglans sp. TaxID=1748965 RepID=A0A653A879_UNCDX
MGETMSMAIRGVLFDFDGTLTRPGALDFRAIKEEIRCPADIPILEYLEGLPEGERRIFSDVLERWEQEAALRSLPNAGVQECLLQLKAKALSLGILTRNSARSLRLAFGNLRPISLQDFSVVITRDDARPKPHPEGVLKAAEAMGFPPHQMLMVGDFRFDVMAGARAGALSVLLSAQPSEVMQPGDPEPDYVIGELRELLKILQDGAASGRRRISSREVPALTGSPSLHSPV